MNPLDKNIYLDRYNNRLDQFGDDPRTLGWGGGLERQNLRFSKILEIGIDKEESLLDVGCGFCDMYGYLNSAGWNGVYTGLDINEKLLQVARSKYEGVDCRNIDILQEGVDFSVDYVVSSGIFNARLHAENNLEYIEEMLARMFSFARKGIVADFMTTFVDFMHADAYHSNPLDIIAIARKLNWKSVLRMDYLPYEFMIYIYK